MRRRFYRCWFISPFYSGYFLCLVKVCFDGLYFVRLPVRAALFGCCSGSSSSDSAGSGGSFQLSFFFKPLVYCCSFFFFGFLFSLFKFFFYKAVLLFRNKFLERRLAHYM